MSGSNTHWGISVNKYPAHCNPFVGIAPLFFFVSTYEYPVFTVIDRECRDFRRAHERTQVSYSHGGDLHQVLYGI